jgi:[acyl-carrier-protein] S-malonyltransferase
MGAELPQFAALAAQARRAVGIELMQRCVTDPDPVWEPAELQQAIFVTTCAAAAAARERQPAPDAVVGHSLGEYAALVAADVLDFETALQLVDVRGRAMAQAQADAAAPGPMAAVIGLPHDAIAATCATLGDVWIANVSSPRQTVVSGTRTAVAAAAEQLERAGARMGPGAAVTVARSTSCRTTVCINSIVCEAAMQRRTPPPSGVNA